MNEQVERLYSLARECGVSLGEACDRAGIARSTPSRWRRGSEPHGHLLSRLDAAIRALACEKGTQHVAGDSAEPTADQRSVIRSELRRARRSIDRIAKALDIEDHE